MLSQIGFPGRSKPVKGKEGSRMGLREERSFSREDLSQPGRDLWSITEPEWLSFCTAQLWTQAVLGRRGCGKSWPSIAEKSTQLQSACWSLFPPSAADPSLKKELGSTSPVLPQGELFKINLFDFAALNLCCYTQAFCSRGEQGPLSGLGAQASHCSGFSCCRPPSSRVCRLQ